MYLKRTPLYEMKRSPYKIANMVITFLIAANIIAISCILLFAY